MKGKVIAEVKKQNWYQIIELAHKHVSSNLGVLDCFKRFAICVNGVIASESVSELKMFTVTDGFNRLSSPMEYLELPNYITEVYEIIQEEIKCLKE